MWPLLIGILIFFLIEGLFVVWLRWRDGRDGWYER